MAIAWGIWTIFRELEGTIREEKKVICRKTREEKIVARISRGKHHKVNEIINRVNEWTSRKRSKNRV